MFGSRTDRPKKKIYWDLVQGEPISPRHDRPQAIGDGYPNLCSDGDRAFFVDFFDFADVMNWGLGDDTRWRLQELSSTELRIDSFDGPRFGRRYEVFHGPIRLGTLEISGLAYTRIKQVSASVELQWVRLLSWQTLSDFLTSVVTHICDYEKAGEGTNAVRTALMRSLWDSLSIGHEDLGLDWGNLELTLSGNAQFFFERKSSEHFQKTARS